MEYYWKTFRADWFITISRKKSFLVGWQFLLNIVYIIFLKQSGIRNIDWYIFILCANFLTIIIINNIKLIAKFGNILQCSCEMWKKPLFKIEVWSMDLKFVIKVVCLSLPHPQHRITEKLSSVQSSTNSISDDQSGILELTCSFVWIPEVLSCTQYVFRLGISGVPSRKAR